MSSLDSRFFLSYRLSLTALVVCTLCLTGCKQGTRSVPFVNGTIDAFENGDQTSELGNQWETIAEGAGTYAEIYIPEGGYDGSRFSLVLEGVRPQDASGSQVVGVRVSVEEAPPAADPDREKRPADVSAFTGLALAMRGTPGTYIIQLGSSLVQDFDFYNSYVEVGEEWSEFMIPFNQFHQEGFGQSVEWDSRNVKHVAFYANISGSFRFAIDDVRFY